MPANSFGVCRKRRVELLNMLVWCLENRKRRVSVWNQGPSCKDSPVQQRQPEIDTPPHACPNAQRGSFCCTPGQRSLMPTDPWHPSPSMPLRARRLGNVRASTVAHVHLALPFPSPPLRPHRSQTHRLRTVRASSLSPALSQLSRLCRPPCLSLCLFPSLSSTLSPTLSVSSFVSHLCTCYPLCPPLCNPLCPALCLPDSSLSPTLSSIILSQTVCALFPTDCVSHFVCHFVAKSVSNVVSHGHQSRTFSRWIWYPPCCWGAKLGWFFCNRTVRFAFIFDLQDVWQ